MTIGQKMTQIRNDIIMKFGELDKEYHFTETIINSIDIITQAFGTLGNDISSNRAIEVRLQKCPDLAVFRAAFLC